MRAHPPACQQSHMCAVLPVLARRAGSSGGHRLVKMRESSSNDTPSWMDAAAWMSMHIATSRSHSYTATQLHTALHKQSRSHTHTAPRTQSHSHTHTQPTHTHSPKHTIHTQTRTHSPSHTVRQPHTQLRTPPQPRTQPQPHNHSAAHTAAAAPHHREPYQ